MSFKTATLPMVMLDILQQVSSRYLSSWSSSILGVPSITPWAMTTPPVASSLYRKAYQMMWCH